MRWGFHFILFACGHLVAQSPFVDIIFFLLLKCLRILVKGQYSINGGFISGLSCPFIPCMNCSPKVNFPSGKLHKFFQAIS
jgi:hypothetical protein